MWHEACARQIGSGGLIPDQQEGLLPAATLGAPMLMRVVVRQTSAEILRLRAAGKVTEVALAGKVATPVSYTHLTLPTICSV